MFEGKNIIHQHIVLKSSTALITFAILNWLSCVENGEYNTQKEKTQKYLKKQSGELPCNHYL